MTLWHLPLPIVVFSVYTGSTPIINPPQSAIFRMHNIIERPVAVNDKAEIRPMMYLAVSYDPEFIIDGRESVGFLDLQ